MVLSCSITSVVSYFLCVADCKRCAVLFRKYISRKASGKGKAILEFVGLTSQEIKLCYENNPLNEEEAIQDGLNKWHESCVDHCTWQVLLNAMEFAGIAQQHCKELVEELHQLMQSEVIFPLKYSGTLY